MIFLVYCIISLFYSVYVLSPGSWPYVIYFLTPMARYILFVLKVPLNTKQTNNLSTANVEILLQFVYITQIVIRCGL